MDYSNLKLPRPNIVGILISIALGVLVAIGIYQAQVRGLILSTNLPKPANLETKTIVQEENAIISVVEKSSPSVVAIGVSQRGFREESTVGTGFVVSENGLIVTNKHVVSGEGTYTVVTRDGQKYEVRRIYRDPILDLALVQIESSDLVKLELGDSSKLKVGQTVIAIGNALGKYTNTVTTGIVSGLGRAVVAGDPFFGSLEKLDNLIQTDAAINPGNSGGPLLSSSGEVIAVSVATTEGAQNIGFAIPINTVKPIVEEFIAKGSVSRPYLGIRYRFISKDVATLNEVPQGAYIQEVIFGGPAQKAGVLEGDIIIKINDQDINEENKLSEIVAKAIVGARLELTVFRDNKEIKLAVLLEESTAQ